MNMLVFSPIRGVTHGGMMGPAGYQAPTIGQAAGGGGGGSVDIYYSHVWRRRRKMAQT